MNATIKLPQPQIIQLNGLRGIAILFVLFLHLFNNGFLTGVFYFGWSGVDLFFVLSGFLITGILFDTKDQKGYFKNFWFRRVLRIFPLYYATLIVFAFISPHFPVTAWFGKYQLYFWTYTSNYLLLKKGFFFPLSHFWSLAIEEQFYLFWPIIVWILKAKQLLVVALLFIVAGIVIRMVSVNEYLIFGLPFAHLDGLMIGGILATLIRSNKELLLKYTNTLFALLLFVLVAYMVGYLYIYKDAGPGIFIKLPFTFTVVSMFFGSLLLMSLKNLWLKEILSTPLLLFFGKYSYGMYVFNSILFFFSLWAGADRLTPNQQLIVFAGVFILTIVMSWLSYNLFEVYFLRLKDTKIKDAH